MMHYENNTEKNLASIGFSVDNDTTEEEIREYFTRENFSRIMGRPCDVGLNSWNDVDFNSFISAAIEELENI